MSGAKSQRENEYNPMPVSDIEELMRLRRWSEAKLAAELDVHQTTVHYWRSGRNLPSGPAKILMRIWLDESREEEARVAKNGKHKLVGAR